MSQSNHFIDYLTNQRHDMVALLADLVAAESPSDAP